MCDEYSHKDCFCCWLIPITHINDLKKKKNFFHAIHGMSECPKDLGLL